MTLAAQANVEVAAIGNARPLGGVFALMEGAPKVRSAPTQAGGAFDRGLSVGIGRSPGHDEEPK